jgi:hypothetical protein
MSEKPRPAPRRTKFEGREVIGTEVTVAGAGASILDGADPYYVGDRVFVVCEAVVTSVAHVAVKDSDALTRVAKARSLIGAVVNADLVRDAIEMARMNAEAEDGIQRLGLGAEDGEP